MKLFSSSSSRLPYHFSPLFSAVELSSGADNWIDGIHRHEKVENIVFARNLSLTMAGISTDVDLDEYWDGVAQACVKITKWDLNSKNVLTVDEMIEQIKPPKKAESGAHERAKKYFKSALTCVQKFGDIVASATSAVFGPSQQCVNAINFVIKAIQDYDEVFSDITTLMERVTAFLEKLKIYLKDEVAGTKLDQRLRLTVYRVLEHFLTIMAVTHQLTTNWKSKVKLAIKIGAFGQNKDISDAMARLETLVSDVTSVEITVIVKDISKAAQEIRGMDRKIDGIADTQKQTNKILVEMRASEEMRAEQGRWYMDSKNLEKLDRVDEASFDSAETDDRHRECLAGTRVEILGRIRSWVKVSDEGLIFWLGGIAGTGKSTIAITLAHSLHTDKYCVLSFFFERGAGARANSTKLIPTLAYQLAIAVPWLRHAISEAIEKDERLCRSAAVPEQFDELILTPLGKYLEHFGQPCNVILVLDALDECEDDKKIQKFIRLLIDSPCLSAMGIRIIITSRPDAMFGSVRNVGSVLYEELELDGTPRQTLDADIGTFLIHELELIKRERSIPGKWPSERQLRTLVEKAAGLFIYASTACKFIGGSKKVRPVQRLDKLCEESNAVHKFSELDKMYMYILTSAFDDEGDDEEDELQIFFDNTRHVIEALVVLRDNLSILDLAVILQNKVEGGVETIEEVLRSLQSIIYVGSDGLIRLIHLSFRDFVVDPKRCQIPQCVIDERSAHSHIATRCLKLMGEQLHENMCALASPGIHTSEIDQATINARVPPDLRYACRFWLDHIVRAGWDLIDNKEVHNFLHTSSLYFLETMSLIGRIPECTSILVRLESLVQVQQAPQLFALVYDLRRFVLTFLDIAKAAPLQIYYQAAHFSPTESLVRHLSEFESIPRYSISSQIPSRWGACRLIILSGRVYSAKGVQFSPDDTVIALPCENRTMSICDVRTGERRYTLDTDLQEPPGTIQDKSLYQISFCFSPDGSTLITPKDTFTTVQIWDIKTGECQQTLKGHSDWITSVQYSPDGSRIASGSRDKTVRIWDSESGECIRTLDGSLEAVSDIEFSPDGLTLASSSTDTTLRLWDVSTGECRHTLEEDPPRTDLDGFPTGDIHFSPDSLMVTIEFNIGLTVPIWNVKTGEMCQRLWGHTDSIKAVQFSPDGSSIASASSDHSVRIWDIDTGACLHVLECPSSVASLQFSPDGLTVASGCRDGNVRMWGVKTGECRQVLEGHFGSVYCVKFSYDGSAMVSSGADGTVRLWDVGTGGQQQVLGHSGRIYEMQISPDGSTMASCSGDGTVRLWSAKTKTSQRTLKHSEPVRNIQFSPDGSTITSASLDEALWLWDVGTGERRHVLEHSGTVSNVRFSPDGRLLASHSSSDTVRIWDVGTGECRQRMGNIYELDFIQFSPDGLALATGFMNWRSRNKEARMWDVTTGQCQRVLKIPCRNNRIARISLDGSIIAVRRRDTVEIWDFESVKLRQTIRERDRIDDIQLSADGSTLASSDGERTCIWDIKTGQCRQTLAGHSDGILRIKFLPDGSAIPWEFEGKAVQASVEHEWVTVAGRKVLWLPEEYRSSRCWTACSSDTLVIGSEFGKITFITL